MELSVELKLKKWPRHLPECRMFYGLKKKMKEIKEQILSESSENKQISFNL